MESTRTATTTGTVYTQTMKRTGNEGLRFGRFPLPETKFTTVSGVERSVGLALNPYLIAA